MRVKITFSLLLLALLLPTEAAATYTDNFKENMSAETSFSLILPAVELRQAALFNKDLTDEENTMLALIEDNAARYFLKGLLRIMQRKGYAAVKEFKPENASDENIEKLLLENGEKGMRNSIWGTELQTSFMSLEKKIYEDESINLRQWCSCDYVFLTVVKLEYDRDILKEAMQEIDEPEKVAAYVLSKGAFFVGDPKVGMMMVNSDTGLSEFVSDNNETLGDLGAGIFSRGIEDLGSQGMMRKLFKDMLREVPVLEAALQAQKFKIKRSDLRGDT